MSQSLTLTPTPLATAKFFQLLVLLIHFVLLIVLAVQTSNPPPFLDIFFAARLYFVSVAVLAIGLISCLVGAVGNWTSN